MLQLVEFPSEPSCECFVSLKHVLYDAGRVDEMTSFNQYIYLEGIRT